tara:strand:+ start:605 stop:775 length:171 start_codon:yes stop_codon:yes gene_type:complete
MTIIEKIQDQYANERAELQKQYESKAITQSLRNEYLQQLTSAENMDLMDAVLEGEC